MLIYTLQLAFEKRYTTPGEKAAGYAFHFLVHVSSTSWTLDEDAALRNTVAVSAPSPVYI
jgi:hypothetical protein